MPIGKWEKDVWGAISRSCFLQNKHHLKKKKKKKSLGFGWQ